MRGGAEADDVSWTVPLKEIRVRNLRCFEDERVPLHPQVTVLVGENGSGKSSLVEALAAVAFDDRQGPLAFPIRHGTEDGSVELLDESGAVADWSNVSIHTLPARPWLLAYGRYRGVAIPSSASGVAAHDIDATLLLSPEWDETPRSRDLEYDRTSTIRPTDSAPFRALIDSVVALVADMSWRHEVAASWARFRASLLELGEGIKDVRIQEIRGRDRLVLLRRGTVLEFNELADGYRSILAIVLDLFVRFASASERDDPLQTAAVVVVDEVCLHLHPRWQRGVIRQLTTMFPNVQWILTTHSAAVVQAAIDDGFGVIRLVDDTPRVRPLSVNERSQLYEADLAAVIMSTETFGVGSRYSKAIEEIEATVTRLRKRLRGANPDQRKELLAALDRLQALHARDDRRRGGQVLLSELAKTQLALAKELEAKLAAT